MGWTEEEAAGEVRVEATVVEAVGAHEAVGATVAVVAWGAAPARGTLGETQAPERPVVVVVRLETGEDLG